MKRLMMITASVLLMSVPAAQAQDLPAPVETPPEIVEEFDRDIVVSVNGMVCDFCAQSIEKIFSKNEAVDKVDVNLDKQEVIIDLKDGQTISDEVVTEGITWAGYEAVKITRQ